MNNIIFYVENTFPNGGIVSILLLTLLSIMALIGLFLGIKSILKSKNAGLPVEMKLLSCLVIITIIMGIFIFIIEYIYGFVYATGISPEMKKTLLRMQLQYSLGSLLLACLSAFIQFILFAISCIIIQSRETNPINLINKIISLPKTIILTLLMTPLILIGVGIPIYQIYDILTLKPDEALPLLLGMEATNILYICFIASIIGLISIFAYFASIIINKIKKLKGD